MATHSMPGVGQTEISEPDPQYPYPREFSVCVWVFRKNEVQTLNY